MDTLETVIQLAQKCLQESPVIVLGSGHSAAYGISGMGGLKSHLLANVKPGPTTQEQEAWNGLKVALQTDDLETALQKVAIPASLLADVIHQTRGLILSEDLAVFERIATGETTPALVRLYRHLFNSTNHSLSVVTTNYDRIAEYAADLAHFCHYTGFTGHHLGFFDSVDDARRRLINGRLVEVWKVHGSLDWFADSRGVVIALPGRIEPPKGLTPLLVTPGSTKYEATHQEPFRSIMHHADAALVSGRSYLCVGYGFNDIHIQPKLVERVRHQSTPLVILARTLTNSARTFVAESCKSSFLAFERADTATRVYSQEHPEGIELPSTSLWQLDRFLDATIGPA